MRKTAAIFAFVCFLGTCSAAPSLFAADGTWTKTWNVSGAAADLRVEADYGTLHIVHGAASSIHANVTT
ncbi:MAG: hypothetical protein WA020_01645, partial [Candidatus Acidiferrales bacterium]